MTVRIGDKPVYIGLKKIDLNFSFKSIDENEEDDLNNSSILFIKL